MNSNSSVRTQMHFLSQQKENGHIIEEDRIKAEKIEGKKT